MYRNIFFKKKERLSLEKNDKKKTQKPIIKLKTQDFKTQILMISPSINSSLHWQIAGKKEHFLTVTSCAQKELKEL
jgi:hypothetical protein